MNNPEKPDSCEYIDDDFTWWCCYYCDGELTVTAIYKGDTHVKCKCGATGFIHQGKLFLRIKNQSVSMHKNHVENYPSDPAAERKGEDRPESPLPD